MITLRNKDTGEHIGTVGDSELQVLVDSLEEESTRDTDYFINEETIDLLVERGASDAFVALLRRALGSREGIEVEWERA